jgi:uncharacterized protein (TIGR00297 family)
MASPVSHRSLTVLFGLSLGGVLVLGGLSEGNFFLPANFFWGLSATFSAMGLALLSRKIDLAGTLIGGLIAFSLFLGGGFPAMGLLLAFFVLGSWASHWKKAQKITLGLAQENEGMRSARHAIANAGTAAVCGLLAWLFPAQSEIWLFALAASLASATGDTFSSELGNLLGRRYWDLLSFQPGKRGADGVISLEGTLAGLGGSTVIALLAASQLGSAWQILGVALIGLAGNLMDSLLGATLQRRTWLSNDQVNYASTLFAALIAAL